MHVIRIILRPKDMMVMTSLPPDMQDDEEEEGLLEKERQYRICAEYIQSMYSILSELKKNLLLK